MVMMMMLIAMLLYTGGHARLLLRWSRFLQRSEIGTNQRHYTVLYILWSEGRTQSYVA